MKIAVMADGVVGRAVVHFLATEHPEDVIAIVVVDDKWVAEWKGVGKTLPSHVRRLKWSERAELRRIKPDLLLLAWWPYILKETDLGLAPFILNMHPSLLPHCRGKDPNFWAIVEQRPFGVTIHHVEASIDGGPIAFQREIPLNWESTGKSLYEAAQKSMVELFIESYPVIRTGAAPRIPQRSSEGSFHLRSELEPASDIDLDRTTTARQLLNLLRARAFAPHPSCRFSDGGETYEVSVAIKRLSTDAARN